MAGKRNELLSPEFLGRLERLSLLARRPVQGWAAGQRRSRRPGRSVEFCDYRAYGVGDDLRYVDWNVFGRSDRLYVKLFVDDEDLCLHLLVDASASMDFGEPSKLDWACRVAASLGFVGLAGLERVGLGVLRERVSEGRPPARGKTQITPMFDFLAGVRGGGHTNLNDSLASYAGRSRASGMVVLISDLMDPAGYAAGLSALLERRLEVHVIHVLSPEELEPAFNGDLRLIDHETGETRPMRVDAEVLNHYRERLQRFLQDAEAFCAAHAIGYHRASSDMPLEQFVFGPLRGRLLA